MAWEFAGNMYGAPPLVMRMQIGANTYVGQLLMSDVSNGYGHCLPCACATADPDVTADIVGVCTGIVNSPTFSSTYSADLGTYDTTQAAQLANDPKGAVEVEVVVARPGDLFKAPLYKVAMGTSLDVITVTTADTAGDDIVHTADTITAPTHKYSTIYCRTGANRGLYRVINSGGTKDQDVVICFPYDIAIDDTFVAAQIILGGAKIDISTNAFGIDGDSATAGTAAFDVFCHRLNLEEAGKEFAVVSFASHHLWTSR